MTGEKRRQYAQDWYMSSSNPLHRTYDIPLIHELTDCVSNNRTQTDVPRCYIHVSVAALSRHSRGVDQTRGCNLQATSENIDSVAFLT
jgi:hypothetical protein